MYIYIYIYNFFSFIYLFIYLFIPIKPIPISKLIFDYIYPVPPSQAGRPTLEHEVLQNIVLTGGHAGMNLLVNFVTLP